MCEPHCKTIDCNVYLAQFIVPAFAFKIKMLARTLENGPHVAKHFVGGKQAFKVKSLFTNEMLNHIWNTIQ